MELFQFHPSVESDLAEILDYIGQADFDAAVRALLEFEDAFFSLV
jgi:plasmid stabilization system protein ParE